MKRKNGHMEGRERKEERIVKERIKVKTGYAKKELKMNYEKG
jgi:hypothetical protein